MATEIATAYVSIVPSTRGLAGKITKEFGQVERAAGDTGRAAGKRMSSGIADSLKGIGKLAAGALAAVGTIGVGAVLGDAVKQAGDLEQSVGAVQAVFKGQAGQMMGWAKEAATAVGLSRNEYQELATVLGAQLKNGGTALEEIGGKTNNLIGLGADLASMFGGTTKEAVEAMTSALRGETDPIERYGVSVNAAKVEAEALAMGAEKVSGEFSQQAKQAAILSLITKQTVDAQGNFNREADTFAGKQQRMSAQWQDLKAKMGELFLPTLSNVMGFVTGTALPAFEDFIGGLRAFGEAWKANDGDVTSSGFAGFMERFANKLRDVQEFLAPVGRWLQENKGIWGPFAAGVGLVTAGFAAWSVAAWAVGGAIAFITSPITLAIAGISLLVGALIYAYRNFEWFRDGVDAVWGWIKSAAAAVVSWFVGSALPWIQNALSTMGAAFSWLYNNVIKPVWNGIKVYVAVVVGTLLTLWQGIKWAIDNVLTPAFRFLYSNVIRPVWDSISLKISAAWTGIKAVWSALKGVIDHVLAPAFRWFYSNVIRPVWDNISSKIGNAWSFLRDKVFNPLISVVRDKVGPAFNAAKDAVKRAWDKIQDIVKKPVKFVIDTVINGALIKNINKVLGTFNMDKIAEVSSGFARGGYTGPGSKYQPAGIVHADEFVIRKESQNDISRTAPGLLDAMNKYGSAALFGGYANGGRVRPVQGPVSSGYGPRWGGFHDGIDFAAPTGTPVRAAGAGRVIRASWSNFGGGNQVEVMHGDGLVSWYAHLSSFATRVGEMVRAGEMVGRVGSTGNSSGPHLHFSVFQGGWPNHRNPNAFLGGALKGDGTGGGWFDPVGMITGGVKGLIDKITGGNPGIAGTIAKGAGTFLLDKAKDWAGGAIFGGLLDKIRGSAGGVNGVWDDPVGTVQPLRPGYSTIYNGTGGTEFFQRVQPGGGGVVELSAADRALLSEIAEAVDIELEGESVIRGIRRAKSKTRDRSPL